MSDDWFDSFCSNHSALPLSFECRISLTWSIISSRVAAYSPPSGWTTQPRCRLNGAKSTDLVPSVAMKMTLVHLQKDSEGYKTNRRAQANAKTSRKSGEDWLGLDHQSLGRPQIERKFLPLKQAKRTLQQARRPRQQILQLHQRQLRAGPGSSTAMRKMTRRSGACGQKRQPTRTSLGRRAES